MDKGIYIKTNKIIGEFIHNSLIDNLPIRLVNEDELSSLDIHEYSIIDTSKSMTIDEVHEYKKETIENLNNK